jgi:serine/threonine protein phosphatase PrpC
LGHAPDLEPEIVELQVERGDLILLATDGVYPRLTEEDFSEYYSLLNKREALDLAIKQQNQRLIEIALAKGNTDNQAVISIICG